MSGHWLVPKEDAQKILQIKLGAMRIAEQHLLRLRLPGGRRDHRFVRKYLDQLVKSLKGAPYSHEAARHFAASDEAKSLVDEATKKLISETNKRAGRGYLTNPDIQGILNITVKTVQRWNSKDELLSTRNKQLPGVVWQTDPKTLLDACEWELPKR